MVPQRHLAVVRSTVAGTQAGVGGAGRPRETMDDISRLRNLRSPLVDTDPVTASLQRAGRGDESAFAEFYGHVSAIVYGIVLRIVRDPAMSEEVTQEVFMEIWRQAPRFDRARGSAQSWAATIAHRRAVDRVRSEQSARDRDLADSRRDARSSDDILDEVVDRLDRGRVLDALDQLTDAQREAVALAYFGGHTYREVAVLLGVPEGTVKTRIRDGLIKLRDLMGVAS